jgi:hypothetical protein
MAEDEDRIRTRQELLDESFLGVMRQGKASVRVTTSKFPSFTSVECMYRSPDGCRCGIGQLIPDAAYRPSFEGRGVRWLVYDPEQFPRVSALRDGTPLDEFVDGRSPFAKEVKANVELLERLQGAHDQAAGDGLAGDAAPPTPEEFIAQFRRNCTGVAWDFNLLDPNRLLPV